MKKILFIVSIILFALISCEKDSELPTYDGEVYALDISKDTEFDFMVFIDNGSHIFYNIDNTTGIPTKAFLHIDGIDYLINYDKEGYPATLTNGEDIYVIRNLRNNMVDFALIEKDNTVKYFFDETFDYSINTGIYNKSIETKTQSETYSEGEIKEREILFRHSMKFIATSACVAATILGIGAAISATPILAAFSLAMLYVTIDQNYFSKQESNLGFGVGSSVYSHISGIAKMASPGKLAVGIVEYASSITSITSSLVDYGISKNTKINEAETKLVSADNILREIAKTGFKNTVWEINETYISEGITINLNYTLDFNNLFTLEYLVDLGENQKSQIIYEKKNNSEITISTSKTDNDNYGTIIKHTQLIELKIEKSNKLSGARTAKSEIYDTYTKETLVSNARGIIVGEMLK